MSGPRAADLIRSATLELEAAGIENAAHDAKRLLVAALGADAGAPLVEHELSDSEHTAFRDLLTRRLSREPLQHILGHTSILYLDIKTDARALIPRDDSAELILLAQNRLKARRTETLTIADLGTGTGVLLAECLSFFTNAKGIAIEKSQDALSLAEENFIALGLRDRTDLFYGSWTDWTGWSACDLIVSNPPYIRSAEIETLAPEVKGFDPSLALDGGPDGLDAYRQIIEIGANTMQPGAQLVLEIGYDQKAAVTDLLEAAGFTDLEHAQDLGGQDRAIAATKT